MNSTRVLSNLLHTLYAAPTQPELWPEFLREFSKALKLTGAAILHQNLARGEYNAEYAFGAAADGAPMYQRYYGKLDAWRPSFLEKSEGEFAFGSELCSLNTLKKTEFYNDFLLKHDLCLYGAVATVKRPTQVELVTLYKSWKGRLPGADTQALIDLMIPHVQRALQLRRSFVNLRVQSASLESALNLVTAGIVFLDHEANVVLMNRSAEDLSRGNGLSFSNGRLFARFQTETSRLESLIRSAIAAASGKLALSGGSMLVSRTGLRPLSLIVAPLAALPNEIALRAAAVIFIYDPEKQVSLPMDILKRDYGLTLAESRLALFLVEGHSVREAADMIGVTFHTARSQLKSIFAKTGVRRQGELIRLLLATTAQSGKHC